MFLMATRLRNYPWARGMLGLWSRKLWLVCILAQVKLICNEAVKLTRKGERPLPLGMGRCHFTSMMNGMYIIYCGHN